MEYKTLGRTGLRVSVMGLGCGGNSRIGRAAGRSEIESAEIVRQALDAGVNFFDTAEGYGTEEALGRGIAGIDRGRVVLSTKKSTEVRLVPQDVERSLEDSLRRLGTDYVDIYHLHAIMPEDYDYLVEEIYPILLKIQRQGKVRFLGATEMFTKDPTHTVMARVLKDDLFDVIMVGFNLLNQSAHTFLSSEVSSGRVGTLIMFAVRRAFSKTGYLQQCLTELIERGEVDSSEIQEADPLGFLVHEGGAIDLRDAAYRFCRHQQGADVVLSGTGDSGHLRQNLESMVRPALPSRDLVRVRRIFARVYSATGN